MNRKGFAVMFDWIFSLVAGILIFSFLIYFAVQHTDLFGKITSKVVAEELDVLFSQYETTETKSTLDFGKKVELEFKCDDQDNKQWFKVNGRDGKRVWGKIIFSPEKIESQKINIATMSWDVPFRVANFVFLWDKQYTLIGEIPDVDLLDNFQNSNTANIRFVDDPGLSDDYGTGECADFGDQHEKIIYYKKNLDDSYVGYICFYKGEGEVQRSSFYGEAMMIGAMFVDGVEDFDCIKKIANDRLRIVADIYDEKSNDLVSLQCDFSGGYTQFGDEVDDLKNIDPLNINQINVDQLKYINRNLIGNGCASVY